MEVKVEVESYFSPVDMCIHIQVTASTMLDKMYYGRAKEVLFMDATDQYRHETEHRLANEARINLASFLYAEVMDS